MIGVFNPVIMKNLKITFIPELGMYKLEGELNNRRIPVNELYYDKSRAIKDKAILEKINDKDNSRF